MAGKIQADRRAGIASLTNECGRTLEAAPPKKSQSPWLSHTGSTHEKRIPPAAVHSMFKKYAYFSVY